MATTLPVVAKEHLEQRLREAFEGIHHLLVEDLTGSQDHYRVTIVATDFEGLSRVAQHQRVYRSLGDWMYGPIHALALDTHTPQTWAATQGT